MNKTVGGLRLKAILLIAFVATVVALLVVFATNNIPFFNSLTEYKGSKWYNPTTWFGV